MDLTNLLNEVVISALGLGLVALAYFAWFLSGAIPNIFSDRVWSWRKGFEDVCKALLMGIVVILVVTVANLGKNYATILGFDISQITDVVSTYSLAGAIVLGIFYYLGKAFKNALKFLHLDDTTVGTIKGNQEQFEKGKQQLGQDTLEIVNGIVTSLFTSPEVAETQKQFELEGGQGIAYSVPIDTYERFRNCVLGKGYDIDGAYSYQCWDGCALLWQQLGLSLITGNGCAYGCWTLKKDVNKYDKFDLITDVKQIKRGDVLVFRAGVYGHIGFADENYSNASSIKLLGQNQGGTPVGAGGVGAGFNIINMSLSSFLGAFRYKGWASKEAEIVPDKKPATKPTDDFFKVGDKVEPIQKVDYDGRKLRQYDDFYTITQISGDRAVLSARGQIWAALNTNNIRKV